jgi:hypothetical protein
VTQCSTVTVCRLSVDGRRFYPWHSKERADVRWSKTRNSLRLPDGIVLRRVKGGINGGNFVCSATGDVYRVWK